ncbi:M67 family metallopeptidase [Paenibacillus camerounensis]|uniref:M67 family metallopeptidase n=1 Tax=Paenibacillus camerounensis TaxID=1243663 RepID=UPI0006944612|nr:M67 family metallopeptidase [Paenibacillus camerounensis]
MTTHQGTPPPIRLDSSVQLMLGKHLLTCLPHEACGLLLGTAAAGGILISSYVPLSNVAPDPLHAFVPDPSEWVRAMFSSPAPIGLFHSHPTSPPWPSPADIQGLIALGPEFRVYLIGSPGQGGLQPPALNGFIISRESGADGPQLLHTGLQALLK